ncbi:MAG: bacteriocin [Melioribacteraceae bacterium]|nr:bacteriocin [Melioribacteraceae bacterium]
MKELSVEQMQQINGGELLACGAMILVTVVGVAGGLGAFAIGFFVGSLFSKNSPC